MRLQVFRYSAQNESTLGYLAINGRFVCHTIEDMTRDSKIYGKTCIPTGTYEVRLRDYGGHHERYEEKFGAEFHKGMLHVIDVPGYTDILIHIGNFITDTEGCLLVGNSSNENATKVGSISDSTSAYKRIYPIIRDALLNKEKVTIEYYQTIY